MPEADPLAPEGRAALRRWLDELYLWNRRANLTAVPVEEAWERHVEESLRLLAAAAPAPGARVVDLGSGGGAPGLPAAVARPDLAVTLVDADSRKAAFLVHAAGLLGLGSRVRVVAARAEDLGRDPAHRGAHDAVLSRAAAPPAVLVELALPLLRVGGRLAVLVGDAEAAAAEARAAAQALGGSAPRAAAPGILVLDKTAATPDTYPRRAGVPARRPLG